MLDEVAKKTPTQDLNDLLYGLQMTTKILDNIESEFDEGLRSQDDFQNRYHSQATLLNMNLKKIKIIVEKMFKGAYSKFVVPEFPQVYMPELEGKGGEKAFFRTTSSESPEKDE
jgi:hypothetical protein